MLYDEFKPVVDLVLNNWTALQLAVAHGMGAPGGETTAQLMSVYVARYCVENVVCVEDLTEALEDLMDEEFDTVCHDNSPKEVATLLLNFLTLIKEGRRDELQAQIDAIPPTEKWLSMPLRSAPLQVDPPQHGGNPDDNTSSSSSEDEGNEDMDLNAAQGNEASAQNAQASGQSEPMDEDEAGEPGWTVVKTRRKK